MEIQPLSPRQIEQFIEHYYRDTPERQQFQRELQRRRELRELARVPALLGFILQLWRKRGSVTDDKLELYEQITLELAQQLDSEKEDVAPDRKWLVEDKDGSLKLDLLRQLAFNQLFKGLIHPPYDIGATANDVDRLVFTGEQLRAEAAAFARTLKEREDININPRNLAEDVKATALLRQVGADHYAFAHLILQEYLAAWQLAKRDNSEACQRIFCRAYFNPTLAEMEVLPMTLGLVAEPDKLYEALEQLPESLDFKGLRGCGRGLRYTKTMGVNKIANIVAQLLTVISEDAESYRDSVFSSFSALNDEASRLIVNSLTTTRKFQSARGAEALGKIGDERAIPMLITALNDKDSGVRTKAIKALGEIGGDNGIAALIDVLKHRDPYLRIEAAKILGRTGDERAIEGLSNALNDDVDAVRKAAEFALKEISIEKVTTEKTESAERKSHIKRQVRIDKQETIEQKIARLLEELDSGNHWLRPGVVSELGRVGDARVVPILLIALKDRDRLPYVRLAAVRGLGGLTPEVLSTGLKRALSHWNDWVKKKAVSVLGYYTMEIFANDIDMKVRSSALNVLLKFERKLQYFDISIPATTGSDYSQPSPPPPLIAQERAELETQIAAKYQEVLLRGDARQKGKALEELLAALFASIPGFTVIERNYHTATEEIDLVLRNASDDPFWRGMGSLILVEAKNWQSQRVGKNEYVHFYRKLENRGGHCTLGFLICTERFAETFHQERLRDGKSPLRIAPIDGEDLRRLVEAEDRGAVLREFVERAVLT